MKSNKKTNKKAPWALALPLLAWGAASTHAEIIITNKGTPDPQCQTWDLSLGGEDADYCAGYYEKPNGEAAETGLLNDVTDGTDWTFIFKTNSDGTEAGPGEFMGIEFSIDTTFAPSGNYTLYWSDVNGADDLNLPVMLDIAFSTKAATRISYYIFEQLLFTDDPYQSSGAFTLQIDHDLSHQSLFVRNPTYPDNPNRPEEQVPVPGTLVLLGLGFGILRWSRRRC